MLTTYVNTGIIYVYTRKRTQIVQTTTIDLTALFIQQMTALFQSYFLIMLVLLSIAVIKANTKTHEWTLRELHLLGWAIALTVYYSYVGAMTFWL